MASTLRALNSIGGFSVGDDPQIVIVQANGDITASNITANGNLVANFANFSGNLNISNANASWGVLTDNLYYSNGAPWDLSNPAGLTNYIQYNDNGSFGADANFQFTASTATLQVTGTANVTGNLNVTQRINGNVGNFSGNINALNANLGNLATANYVNVASDLLVSGSANIVLDLQGNTANFSGNISALNANLGNLATANYINVSSNLKTANLNVTNSVGSNLIPSVSNTYSLGNSTNMWNNLYLSGTTIYIGTQNISANGTAISVSNDFAANNFFATNNVTANGNVYANAGGGAGYVYANFANVQSNLYVGANANIVNTLTAANIKDTNLSNTQIVFANASNTLSGSANFVFDATSNTLSVDNANLVGTLNGNVANFTGNLTSLNANLGNLATANFINVTTLTANTKFDSTAAGNVALGNVANIHIYGGNDGQILKTDGNGNLSWSSTANVNEIQNGNSNVMIATADGNVTITAGGIYTWTFDATTGLMTAPGDIQTNGTMNANVILSAYDITSTGGNLNANSGYVNANYVNVANDLQVNNNANISMTLYANNANIGNLTVTNDISTTGNITANGLTVNLDASLNTANFSGAVVMNSANVTNDLNVGGAIHTTGSGGDITMTGGNISGVNYVFANNANITNFLQGNAANFTGNVDAVNFIGNLANGSSNIQIDSGGNIRFSPGTGYANAVIFSSGGIDTIGYVTANGNITTNTGIVSNTVTAFANTALTLNAGTATGAANINVVLVPSGNGTVDVSSKRITSVATPTSDSDAANKAYVDSVAQGLNIKASVYVATYAALPAYTYNNGTLGVGATITANANGALVVDGQTISTVGTRVLVKNETAGNAPYNGIYTLTTVGDGSTPFVLTRSLDMNVATEFDGAFTFVSVGTHNADTGWVQTGEIVTVGTTAVVWTQFSGAGQYTANTSAGLSLTGTVFSAKVDGNTNPTTAFDGNGNIYVPAGAAFTTPNIGAATGTSVDLSGNVLAGNINSNAMITTANLEVSANILTNNITANTNVTATGNLSGNNANITNLLTVGGNANITNTLNGNVANFSGNLTSLNANLGNLATANYVNVATQLNGNVANFTGNLTSLNANLGNLAQANYVNVANDLNVNGTANLANVSLTGNITANNITSNNRVSATNIKIGNSYIYANTVTTNATTPFEICSFMITNTDVYGIEYIVKSFDPSVGASKYSMATVQAVTNGTDVDYVTYATVRLGNTTGQLSVTRTAVGGDVSINLIANPSSGNATTWTTQYRLI
jgi:hypothetical protein